MPQMKPMNWLLLMILFLINYYMFMLNLSMTFLLSPKKLSINKNKINYNLKW